MLAIVADVFPTSSAARRIPNSEIVHNGFSCIPGYSVITFSKSLVQCNHSILWIHELNKVLLWLDPVYGFNRFCFPLFLVANYYHRKKKTPFLKVYNHKRKYYSGQMCRKSIAVLQPQQIPREGEHLCSLTLNTVTKPFRFLGSNVFLYESFAVWYVSQRLGKL